MKSIYTYIYNILQENECIRASYFILQLQSLRTDGNHKYSSI